MSNDKLPATFWPFPDGGTDASTTKPTEEPTREQRIAAAVRYTHGIVDLRSFGERMTMRRLDEMLQLAAQLGASEQS